MSEEPLPTPNVVAGLVSNITETMFGLTFGIEDAVPRGDGGPQVDGQTWRTLAVRLQGNRDLLVAIASDEVGGRQLSSAMFACPPEDADASMVDDALGELVNIVAGELKGLMKLDLPLGLPQVFPEGLSGRDAPAAWRVAWLRSADSQIRVWIALSEATLGAGAGQEGKTS